MGVPNKRRKAAIIVTGVCAVIFAVVTLAFCFNDFTYLRRDSQANSTDSATVGASHTQNHKTDNNANATTVEDWTFTFAKTPAGDTPLYYVEFAGANGGGSHVASYGATVYGFYRGNSMSAQMQGYRGTSKTSGGGYTRVNLNFNLHSGGSSGYAYAGGGGGDSFYTGNGNTYDQSLGGGSNDGGYRQGGTGGSDAMNGKGASSSSAGAGGTGGSTNGDSGNGTNGGTGASLAGDGGNGARGGGGGGYNTWETDSYYEKDTHHPSTGSGSNYHSSYWSKDKVYYWATRTGDGGGGSSSMSAYPKYVVDNGTQRNTNAGYIKFERLNAAKYPKDEYYPYDGSLRTFPDYNAQAFNKGNMYDGLFQTRFIYCYSTDGGKSYTSWSTSRPEFRAAGTYKVKWRYQIYGNTGSDRPARSNDAGIIKEGVTNFIIQGTGNAGTLSLKRDLTFTGEAQQLVTQGPTNYSTGATIYYAITSTTTDYTVTTTIAKKQNDGLDWKSNYNSLTKPIKAGTYYVHWYAEASPPAYDTSGNLTRPGNAQSKVSWTTVVIGRGRPAWGELSKGEGTLRGTNSIYNGASQALFKGDPYLKVLNNSGKGYNNVASYASIYYSVSESKSSRTNQTETKTLSDLKTKDVDGKTYYLWVRSAETSDLYATSWTCLGDLTASTIKRATISITGLKIAQPDHSDYNGTSQQYVEGTPATNREREIPLNRVADVGTVTYSRWFTPADEVGKDQPAVQITNGNTFTEDVYYAQDAGVYELVVSWLGSVNVYPGETRFQYYTVNKATHGIDLGNQLDLVKEPTIDKVGAQLVRGGYFFCMVDGNRTTAAHDVFDGVTNRISFYWSQDGNNPPDLTKSDVQEAFAAQGPMGGLPNTSEMTLLYDYRTHLAGTWYLWIKFDHHVNIATDTLVRYRYEVVVKPLPANQIVFENVNGGLRHNEDLPFDGQEHEIAAGDFLFRAYDMESATDEPYVVIDERDVEYNIADANGEIMLPNHWVSDKSLLTRATAGRYYLVVRWGHSGKEHRHVNVEDTDANGIILYHATSLDRPFTITIKNNFNDLTFSGLTLNPDSGKMFDTQARPYTMLDPQDALVYTIAGVQLKDDYRQFFGKVCFALATTDEARPAAEDYLDAFEIPTATNVGHYYLYLRWEGDGLNIANNTQGKAYDLTQYLEIIKAVQPNVQIDNITPLDAERRTYTGYGIPLFGYGNDPETATLTGAPILRVKDMLNAAASNFYEFNLLGGEIAFALSILNTEAPSAANSAWSPTLAGAVQTRVNWADNDHSKPENTADYYLWVMIRGDQNIEDSTYLIGGAKLEMKEAYVDQAPTPKPQLVYTGLDQILINGSPQDVEARNGIKPPVEYMLYKDGGEELWVRDSANFAQNLSNTILATDSGTYYVFYRGGNDDNHITQIRDRDKYPSTQNVGYPFITIRINKQNANIKILPSTKNTVYNAQPQTFFNAGFATVGQNTSHPLIYAVYDHAITLSELKQWTGLTDVVIENEDGSTTIKEQITDGVGGNFDDILDKYLSGGNYGNGVIYADYVETDKLMRTNAGTYTIYYKASYHADLGDNPVQSIQIEISRTKITPYSPDYLLTSPDPGITDLYKPYMAAPYDLIRSHASFGLNNTNGLTNSSGTIGTPGLIEYGVAMYDPYTMSKRPEPTEAVYDYHSLTVRDAGVYYLYYRVWAGDNHLGTGDVNLGIEPAWVCFNEGMPVHISQAESDNIELSWSLDNFGETMRYNGQARAVVTAGDVVLTMVVTTDGKTERRPVIDTIGKVWYALTTSTDSPGASSVLWRDSYLSATQLNAGAYYLHVKVEASANLTQIIGCVNPNNPVILAKAIEDDLSISGITVYNRMYNGGPLDLAVGNLQVNTVQPDGTGEKMTITANVLPGIAGYFQYTPYNDRKPLSNWPTEQGLAAATMGTEAGKYYLWVKIPASDNIEEAIVLVNSEYVEITRANEDNIYIVTPALAGNSEYNGQPHSLIVAGAGLALRSGNKLTGVPGDAYYYVSESSSLPRADAVGWTKDFNTITATDRGVYYVFVKYEANAGSNHTDLKPVLAGQVEIRQASLDTLLLGGIIYSDPRTFNGGPWQIANGELTLEIDLGNGNLVPATGTGEIRYAWSNSSERKPTMADSEWKTNLQDLTAVNAGKYYLWVWVGGGENIASFRVCLAADDANQEYMLIKQAAADVVRYSGIEPYSDRLEYKGGPQQLAKGALVQKIAGNEVTSGYVSYGLGFGPNKGQEPQLWYSSLDLVMATDATDITKGEAYYLWVRVEESANIAVQSAFVCSITIDRAKAAVTDILGADSVLNDDGEKIGMYYYQGNQRLLVDAAKANFGEVVYRLGSAGDPYNANDWVSDWREIVGQDAGTYTVYYAVIDNPNWEYFVDHLDVCINPSTAPFIDKPFNKTFVYYNETEQDLIEFGELLPEAFAQGCSIMFRYDGQDENGNDYPWHEYRGANIWGENGRLPGRTLTGKYKILYYTTGGNTGNYIAETDQADFKPHELEVTIQRREIIWLARPEPRYGLKNINTDQVLVTAGQLSAQSPLGATIWYSLDKDDPDSWQTTLPVGKGEQIFYCWYRVTLDAKNNYLTDGDRLYGANPEDGVVTTDPQVLKILMEKLTLSFRGDPQGVTVTYDATEQSLVWGGELSTFDMEGVTDIYVDYKVGNGDWLGQDPETHASILPTASQIGEYTVYYQVRYNPTVYEFTGADHGTLTSIIVSAVIEGNQIKATLTDKDNYVIGFDTGTYTDEFGAELADMVTYQYRRKDKYFKDDIWHPWSEFDRNQIGTYEIRAIIDPNDNTNFTKYEQGDDFETFEIAKDLTVNINIQGCSNYPWLHVWVDLTGDMGYADSPFKAEKPNPRDIDTVILAGVNSPGKGGQGTIRVAAVNDRYYYLSATLVTDFDKTDKDAGIKLSTANTEHAVLSLNPGLDATNLGITAYIYEVYKISYDANTGTGNLPDGWKWHNTPYELADNNFEKAGLVPDGWSKYPSGSGQRYRKGSLYYTDNLSQIFYAQYVGENEQTVIVRWQVGTYEISRTGVWFDATQYPERETGMPNRLNGLIYLPDLSNLPASVTDGRCITGWVRADNAAVHYYWGILATQDEIVFTAQFGAYGDPGIKVTFTSNGTPVHTATVANGGESYLALSGLTATDFRTYDYQKFVDEYKNRLLWADDNDRNLVYELGDRLPQEQPPVINTPNDGADANTGDTTAMIVIIIIGLVIAIVLLVVYLVLRNRKLQMKIKHFKEDQSV